MFKVLTLVSALVAVEAIAQSVGPLSVEDRMSTPALGSSSMSGKGVATDPADEATGAHLLLQEMQQMETRLEQMQGEIEELRHQLETARASERARYIDLDSRISLLSRSLEDEGGGAAEAAVDEDDEALGFGVLFQDHFAKGDAPFAQAAGDVLGVVAVVAAVEGQGKGRGRHGPILPQKRGL